MNSGGDHLAGELVGFPVLDPPSEDLPGEDVAWGSSVPAALVARIPSGEKVATPLGHLAAAASEDTAANYSRSLCR